MKRLLIICSAFVTLFALCSCVHEYPDGEGIDPTVIDVNLKLKTSTPLSSSFYEPSHGLPYMWFVVEIYKDDFKGAPVFKKGIGVKKDDNGIATLEIPSRPLHAGKYKVVAWAMASEKDNGQGLGFSFDDLASITYPNGYYGSSNKKECYESRFSMDLADKGWFASAEYEETLKTPMAAVQVISTDADVFLQNLARNENVQFSDFSIRWRYGLYSITGYDAKKGIPNKSETGILFTAPIKRLDKTDALLGFDYLFVNGEKSQITLSLDVIDNQTGKVINTFDGITVPLEKGKVTTIKGYYLTTSHNAGTGINPGFNGEINITLPYL